MNANEVMKLLFAEAKQVGWPKRFKSDIDWDRALLERCPPGTPFAWLLYEFGTFIAIPNGTIGKKLPLTHKNRPENVLRSAVETFRGGLLYWFDGVSLRRIADAERGAELLLEASEAISLAKKGASFE